MHLLAVPCIAMASVNFYVGAYYLFFYLKRPQLREHLPFALLCLSVACYDVFSAGLYNSHSLANGIFWQRLQLDTAGAIAIFLIWFTYDFTEQKDNRIALFAMVWFIVISLASFFATPELALSSTQPAIKHVDLFNRFPITYYEGTVGILYQVEILSAIIAYLYLCYLFIGYYQRTLDHHTLLLILICQIIYLFGVVNDSLVAAQTYSFIYFSEYSFFCIVLAMAYTLLNKFVNLHAAYEELAVNLEHKVDERTSQIRELNENLKRLAERDGLTGVYNRRFFNEYLEIEMKRARSCSEHKAQRIVSEGNMNFGLALIDVDHFKQINDHYGHLVGDRVLRQVAEIVASNIFSYDVLCRYGGDEFALLLTQTSRDDILQLMEKIRQEVAEQTFRDEFNLKSQQITISVGLVNVGEVLDQGAEAILRVADERLLKAKSLGRNRIVYREEGPGAVVMAGGIEWTP